MNNCNDNGDNNTRANHGHPHPHSECNLQPITHSYLKSNPRKSRFWTRNMNQLQHPIDPTLPRAGKIAWTHLRTNQKIREIQFIFVIPSFTLASLPFAHTLCQGFRLAASFFFLLRFLRFANRIFDHSLARSVSESTRQLGKHFFFNLTYLTVSELRFFTFKSLI